MGISAAANACDFEEFSHNEKLAHLAATDKAAPLLLCFAIHPQQKKVINDEMAAGMEHGSFEADSGKQLEMLDKLAAERRLAAVGECGFDLYNAAFRETEAFQDRIFAAHMETALRHDLPVILHVRRAMHKIFAEAKNLARCKAVVFHSWPGTLEEGQALLRRGVNAYFSFGNVIVNGHKQAMRCCALFPAERLLTETDAPYQPAQGQDASHWKDLPRITAAAAALRSEALSAAAASGELELKIQANFESVFEHQFLNTDQLT